MNPFGGDAFISKFDMVTGQLTYSTFLGGSCGDEGFGIVVDQAGVATVVGDTESEDFPFQSAPASFQRVRAFLARFSPQGQILTAIAPEITGPSTAIGITLDNVGDLYLTGSGQVGNVDFRTFGSGGLDLPDVPVGAAYVLKLDRQDLRRRYLAYFGGIGSGKSIKVDSFGRAWVAGTREGFSIGFPLVAPFQAYVGSTFVAELSADGSKICLFH